MKSGDEGCVATDTPFFCIARHGYWSGIAVFICMRGITGGDTGLTRVSRMFEKTDTCSFLNRGSLILPADNQLFVVLARLLDNNRRMQVQEKKETITLKNIDYESN